MKKPTRFPSDVSLCSYWFSHYVKGKSISRESKKGSKGGRYCISFDGNSITCQVCGIGSIGKGDLMLSMTTKREREFQDKRSADVTAF